MWLRVPESIRVTLTGELPRGVYPKDIALALAKELGADGANYQALEFAGDGLASLELEDRLVRGESRDRNGREERHFPGGRKDLRVSGGLARRAAPRPIAMRATPARFVLRSTG